MYRSRRINSKLNIVLRQKTNLFCYLRTVAVCGAGLVLLMTWSSCANTRQMTYMQGAFDTTALSTVKEIDPTIQKGDLLNIIVYSDNPQATAIYNQAVITVPSSQSSAGGGGGGGAGGGSTNGGAGSGGGTGSSTGVSGVLPTTPGYLVDNRGDIQFQQLGLLHIEGLTKDQLKDTLDSRLDTLLQHPYYTIRFLNYRFTFLGEVNRPGVYSIPGESVNLFEALGLAGDMTFFGRRDNVLVIRQLNGKREFARLDLTRPEVLASPYFYLQENDIIYVEASKKKIQANDQVTTRNVTIAATIVSTIAILYSIFRN